MSAPSGAGASTPSGPTTNPAVVAAGDEPINRAPDKGEQHLPDPSRVRAAREAKESGKRKIAPIPPTKKLGPKPEDFGIVGGSLDAESPADVKLGAALGRDVVAESGEGVDLGEGTGLREPGEKAAKKTAIKPIPNKDAKGRFVSAEPKEDAAEGDEPAELPAPPEEELVQDEREVVVAGKRYKNLGEVEQYVRSLQGQFKPAMQREAQATTRAQEWYKRSLAQDARIKELESRLAAGGGAAAATGDGTAAASAGGRKQATGREAAAGDEEALLKQIAESVDWNVGDLVEKSGDGRVAKVWLIQQVMNLIGKQRQQDIEQLRKELTEGLLPVRETEEKRQLTAHASEIFGQVQDLVDGEGNPAFPELLDANEAAEVGRIWKALDLPAEYVLTPAGVVQAVANYRLYKQLTGRGSTADDTSTDSGDEGDEALDEDALATVAAATRAGGMGAMTAGGTLPPKSRAHTRGDESARILGPMLAAMREAGTNNTFGFPARGARR